MNAGRLGRWEDVEAEIERADRMREGTGGDEVYARLGDGADGREADVAAGLDKGTAGYLSYGGEELVGGEVV